MSLHQSLIDAEDGLNASSWSDEIQARRSERVNFVMMHETLLVITVT